MNVIFLEKRVPAGIIKILDFEMRRLFWIIWVSLNVIVNDLVKGRGRFNRHSGRMQPVKKRQIQGVIHPQTKKPQGLSAGTNNGKRQGMDSLPELLDGVWPWWQLDFQNLASKTRNEYSSVA